MACICVHELAVIAITLPGCQCRRRSEGSGDLALAVILGDVDGVRAEAVILPCRLILIVSIRRVYGRLRIRLALRVRIDRVVIS